MSLKQDQAVWSSSNRGRVSVARVLNEINSIIEIRKLGSCKDLVREISLFGMCLVIFSERELKFMFAICHRRSVCRLSVCRLSSVVCRLSSVVCDVRAPYSDD